MLSGTVPKKEGSDPSDDRDNAPLSERRPRVFTVLKNLKMDTRVGGRSTSLTPYTCQQPVLLVNVLQL